MIRKLDTLAPIHSRQLPECPLLCLCPVLVGVPQAGPSDVSPAGGGGRQRCRLITQGEKRSNDAGSQLGQANLRCDPAPALEATAYATATATLRAYAGLLFSLWLSSTLSSRSSDCRQSTVDSRQSTVVDISTDEVPSVLARALDTVLLAGSILDQDLFSSAAGFYRGMTPLHVAAEHDNANAATALLQHGGAGEPPRIAAIWVAFFSRCQRCRCGQG